MAPANVSSLNPRQGALQGKPQGNWNNRQRGAAAWDNNINMDSSSTVYGQYNDNMNASSLDTNIETGFEMQEGGIGTSKNPGDEEFLHAIQAARTPEQVEEFCCWQKLGLCYNCGGTDNIGWDCKNPDRWDPPKGGTLNSSNQWSDQLRAATFTLEGDSSNNGIWNVKIENNSGKVEGIPETH